MPQVSVVLRVKEQQPVPTPSDRSGLKSPIGLSGAAVLCIRGALGDQQQTQSLPESEPSPTLRTCSITGRAVPNVECGRKSIDPLFDRIGQKVIAPWRGGSPAPLLENSPACATSGNTQTAIPEAPRIIRQAAR